MEFLLTALLLILLIRTIMVDSHGKYNQILLVGLCARLFLLVITLTDIIPIPDAHEDAEAFHYCAETNQNESPENRDYVTNYTVFLTILYSFTNSSRWFAQFVNVVFGVFSLIYLRKILCLLGVSDKEAKPILLVGALMPFLNIYSVVLMREAWVSFFVTFSLFYFVRWYLQQGSSVRNILLTFVGIMLAMWMHAGAVGILIGYTIAFLTYYRKGNKVKISLSTYGALFLLGIFALILMINADAFAQKFLVEDIGEYATNKSGVERGGSDYLIGIDFTNPMNLILFMPLKMFYFLYSPIILDWRGLSDIAAFLMDSIFYIIVTWYALTRKTYNSRLKLMKKYLVVSILVTTAVFAIGTTNAGTAIRHRAKMSSLMLTIWALSPSKKKTKESVITYDSCLETKTSS